MSLGDMYSVHNHVFFSLMVFRAQIQLWKRGLWEPDMFTHRSCNDLNRLLFAQLYCRAYFS